MGMQIGESTLDVLLFADDLVIMAEDEQDMNYMFRKLKQEFDLWGLQINVSKTKYMVTGEHGKDLCIGNDKIQLCDDFKYLGFTVSKEGTSNKDINNKINQGKRVINMLNSILWNSQLSKKTKKNIYSTIIESIVTYGSEVWELTQKNRRRLLTIQMDFLRRSCRISRLHHIRNDEIKDKMEIKKDIIDTVERKQLQWYGHLLRMPEERWPKQVYKWIPPYRRRRGRPSTPWKQGILTAMATRNLTDEDVMDREGWKRGTEKHRQM